jgi:basic membrane lipoprotein Med (substrate-binding protein (PBP1-ABC) superfamily)
VEDQHQLVGLKENGIDLAAFNPELPADVKALVEERKKGIVDGSAPIWKGPIKDNAGKEVLGKDAVADDGFLHGIKFYVEAWTARYRADFRMAPRRCCQAAGAGFKKPLAS